MEVQPMRLAVVPALLLLGCARPHLDLGPSGEAGTADELLRRVDAVEASVQRLSGEARLELAGPAGRGAVGLFVAVGRSASLHLEQLDFFGRPQLVVVSDGQRFTLHDAGSGRWYRGPATGAALGRFLPLPIPPSALAALLLGRAPRLEDPAAELRLDPERGRYLLTLRRGGAIQRLEVDPASARVLRSTSAGLRVDFGDLEALGGVVFPKRLALEAGPTSLQLTWRELTLEPPEDPGLFELQPPGGAAVTELDAEGRESGG
jgi:hypothetical protein